MSKITFKTPDGKMGGYLALPAKTPAPAILVIQEIFGVNQVMRDLCDAYAAQGYVAACPDLFWRIEPGIDITDKSKAEWDKAFALFGAFDVDQGVADLKLALAHLRGMKEVQGKVGTVGYCLGGKLAFLMATRSDADASVAFYGVQLDQFLGEARAITQPTRRGAPAPPCGGAQLHRHLPPQRPVSAAAALRPRHGRRGRGRGGGRGRQ
jgi:carboxymethylenebutenolidase